MGYSIERRDRMHVKVYGFLLFAKNIVKNEAKVANSMRNLFFYVGFLSETFTNHRTVKEGRGHFINSSLSLPPASQTLRH